MIRWLAPLGLLGLLGLVILLIIYLIKPDYKEKKISSTFVWNQVLKQNRRQLPVIYQIITFLLQGLIITSLAFCLAQPFLFSKDAKMKDLEHVIILDTSMSMKSKIVNENDGSTRLERAIAETKKNINNLFKNKDSTVYIILANENPNYLVAGYTPMQREGIEKALNSLTYSFGEADLEGALQLAEERLNVNPYAKIFLYTDTEFGDLGNAVTAINFANIEKEWNVSISGCDVAIINNEFVFDVTLKCSGNVTIQTNLSVTIKNAENGDGIKQTYQLNVPVNFAVNENSLNHETTLEIPITATNKDYGGKDNWFFSTYEEVRLELTDLNDSILSDNYYLVYGGEKDTIKIEYWSKTYNVFWQYGFSNLANNMSKNRDIRFQQINTDYGLEIKNNGYDFYIFEHSIPQEIIEKGLPDDGIVILSNPDDRIKELNLGLSLNGMSTLSTLTSCSSKIDTPLLQYIEPSSIGVTQYSNISLASDSLFVPVLFCNNDPLMLVQNNINSKIIVLPFSINMSNFYGRSFQIFLYNLLNYFMPVTLVKYDYLANETAKISCKGISIDLYYEDKKLNTFTGDFPLDYRFEDIGTYTFITKFGLNKPDEVRKVYVHIPSKESSIFEISQFRIILDNQELTKEIGHDLSMYIILAMFICLIAEWYLQFKYII